MIVLNGVDIMGEIMIIREEKYCIASKDFPLKFCNNGEEMDCFEQAELMSKEDCEYELSTYDEPDKFQILKVQVEYEF